MNQTSSNRWAAFEKELAEIKQLIGLDTTTTGVGTTGSNPTWDVDLATLTVWDTSRLGSITYEPSLAIMDIHRDDDDSYMNNLND